MKTRIFLLAALFIAVSSLASLAKPEPPTTEQVLKDAYAQAAKQHKKVMILFHASWCGWCKKMDASLNDPAIKKSFDDNYVITWLTVLETTPEMKKNENPGAMDLMTKYHGEKAGLPFFLIMDAKGKLLADSYIRPAGASMDTPGDNTGCPASEKEVNYFSDILKATSNIKEPQLALIRARFRTNEPAPAAPALKPAGSE
jgi:thioredoxin-related protein